MGLMQQIQSGRSAAPPRMLVYGTEGIGKSTLAAHAPNPIFVQTEDGLGEIDCHKFPLATSFDDVQAALAELHNEQHDYQTVVIDCLDWLERLIWDAICQDYGGQVDRKGRWRLRQGLRLRPDVLAAVPRPTGRPAQRAVHGRHSDRACQGREVRGSGSRRRTTATRPDCTNMPRALVTEWCDAVLFATRKFRTQTEEAGFGRKRTTAHAIGKDGGERILRTVGGPSCVAKNRYNLDAELPLEWNALLSRHHRRERKQHVVPTHSDH